MTRAGASGSGQATAVERPDTKLLKHEAASRAFFAKDDIRDAFQRNDWNRHRISCRGNHLVIQVNGVRITDYHDGVDSEGYIALQHHAEKGQTDRSVI